MSKRVMDARKETTIDNRHNNQYRYNYPPDSCGYHSYGMRSFGDKCGSFAPYDESVPVEFDILQKSRDPATFYNERTAIHHCCNTDVYYKCQDKQCELDVTVCEKFRGTPCQRDDYYNDESRSLGCQYADDLSYYAPGKTTEDDAFHAAVSAIAEVATCCNTQHTNDIVLTNKQQLISHCSPRAIDDDRGKMCELYCRQSLLKCLPGNRYNYDCKYVFEQCRTLENILSSKKGRFGPQRLNHNYHDPRHITQEHINNFNQQQCGDPEVLARYEICSEFHPNNIVRTNGGDDRTEYCHSVYYECKERNYEQRSDGHWPDLPLKIIQCCTGIGSVQHLKGQINYLENEITIDEQKKALSYYSNKCGYVNIEDTNNSNRNDDGRDHIMDIIHFIEDFILTYWYILLVCLCCCSCICCCFCRYRKRKKTRAKNKNDIQQTKGEGKIEPTTYSLNELQNFDFENYNITDVDATEDDANWGVDTIWYYISSQGTMLGPCKTTDLISLYIDNNFNSLTCIDQNTLLRHDDNMGSWRRLYEMPSLKQFVGRTLINKAVTVDAETGQMRISI
jgi:hypothetical protein